MSDSASEPSNSAAYVSSANGETLAPAGGTTASNGLAPPANTHENASLSVRSRIERLSICEGEATKSEIISNLRRPSLLGSRDINDDDAVSDVSHSESGSKRRRRRSSAVQNSSLDSLKHDNTSTSSIAVPKKKKKSTKAVNVSVENVSKPLSIKDLRDLVLFSFRDTNNSPSWLQIDNRAALQKVVVLFAPGLLPSDFSTTMDPESKITSFAENLEKLSSTHTLPPVLFSGQPSYWYILPLCAPGSKNSLYSAYNSFVNVGLNKKEKEKKKQQLARKKVVMTDLLMNIDDLIENDYPIHLESPGLIEEFKKKLTNLYSSPDYANWVDTKLIDRDGPRTFSIDCEMCMSDNGHVLTRCSVVNFEEELIYDKLVKPDVPIIDYLTKYSGITEEKLQDVSTTLKDVQNDLLNIISSKDVLIGHSLQSDLNVLKLRHPNIVDTAVIYEHKAGPPFRPALRYLASEYLGIDIQKDTGLGHDSFEDAKTCMELTKLKIVNGLTFGIGFNTENLFHRLARNGISSMILNDSASKQSSVLKIENHEVHVRCKDDQMVTDEICEHVDQHNLFVGRFRELEYARKFATCNNPDTKILSEDQALENLGKRITQIYESLPSSAMLLVCSGTGDTREWIEIMSDLNKLDKEERPAEKSNRETEIQASIKTARDAVSFMSIKTNAVTNNDGQ